MRKKGINPENHKWSIAWDEQENEPIDKCEKCGMKRRVRQNYVKGELMRAGKIYEHYVDEEWKVIVPVCKIEN